MYALLPLLVFFSMAHQQVMSVVRCVICEFVVSTLQGLLANQDIENQFLSACSEACQYLPTNEQDPVRASHMDGRIHELAAILIFTHAVSNFNQRVWSISDRGDA